MEYPTEEEYEEIRKKVMGIMTSDRIYCNAINENQIKNNEEYSIEEELEEQIKENKLLQEQLKQKEDIINKAKCTLEKHLNAKNYGGHKYDLFDRKYLEDLLEILDNKV